MSNIYIQEPPTSGKVLLKTSVGDIDIELWTKECPKACRNFIQLCMEGYYNGTIFHRLVKEFIVQGGDPNGDGTGGESIYGEPFKDEFHSRLRYTRRGLVGCANSDIDDNGSQFFFTLAATPELQSKNTLFGKVAGDTIYNMLKLEDGLVDQNERPLYPHRIIGAEVLSNPFDDIVPRVKKSVKKEKLKKREKGVKNFGLLSFGEEAEGDEQETNEFVQQNVGKAKSMHDVVDDPKLSKDVLEIKPTAEEDDERLADDHFEDDVKGEPNADEQRKERIIDKLKSRKNVPKEQEKIENKLNSSDSEEDVLMTKELEMKLHSDKKKEEIRQEIIQLKKQYQTDKRAKEGLLEKSTDQPKTNSKLVDEAKRNDLIQDFIDVKQTYKSRLSNIPKKGSTREDFTLSLLSKFRTKLNAVKEKHTEKEGELESVSVDEDVVEQEIQSDDWLGHTLRFESSAPVLAKDASTKNDDWYDAYDPRNPLNKRKRGENLKSSAKKSR